MIRTQRGSILHHLEQFIYHLVNQKPSLTNLINQLDINQLDISQFNGHFNQLNYIN